MNVTNYAVKDDSNVSFFVNREHFEIGMTATPFM